MQADNEGKLSELFYACSWVYLHSDFRGELAKDARVLKQSA